MKSIALFPCILASALMLFSCTTSGDIPIRGENYTISQESTFHQLKSQGKLLGQEKRYFQAIVKLDQAAALHPNDAQVHLMLGEAYFHIGNAWSSLAHLERSRELAPNTYQIESWIGTVNIEIGQFIAAEEAYSNVLAMKPNDYNALVYMGYIAFHRKDYQTCQQYFQRYKRLVEVIEPARLTEQEKLRYQQATEYFQACDSGQYHEILEQAKVY